MGSKTNNGNSGVLTGAEGPFNASAPLWGEFQRRLDEKGRVSLPAELRAAGESAFVLTRAPDSCVAMVPMAAWQQVQARLEERLAGSGPRSVYRLLAAHTVVRLDLQGRVSLPRHLREWAGVEPGDSVVVMGVGTMVEIWSKCAWDNYLRTFTAETIREAARSVGLERMLP